MRWSRIIPLLTAAIGGIVGAVLVSNVCVHLDSFNGSPRGCYKPAPWGDVPPLQGYVLWIAAGALIGWLLGFAVTRLWRAFGFRKPAPIARP
jgi:hypothetical protein